MNIRIDRRQWTSSQKAQMSSWRRIHTGHKITELHALNFMTAFDLCHMRKGMKCIQSLQIAGKLFLDHIRRYVSRRIPYGKSQSSGF